MYMLFLFCQEFGQFWIWRHLVQCRQPLDYQTFLLRQHYKRRSFYLSFKPQFQVCFSNWLEIRPDTWQTNSAYRAPRGAKQKDIRPASSLADNVISVTFLLIKNFLNDVLSMCQKTEFLMVFKEVIESFILWGIGKFLNQFLLVPSQHRPWRLTFEIPWSLSQTCSFGRQALFQHPFTSSWVTFQIISS